MRYKTIDLFAGCGGLSDGFEAIKAFEMLCYVEWDRAACETLRRRIETRWRRTNAAESVIRFDIQRTDELIHGWEVDAEYGTHPGLESLVRRAGGIDLIIGGPPCQAYSVAGRVRDEHGMHFDYRNYLFESYMAIVRHFRPRAFIFENVPGMLSAAPGGIPIVKRVRRTFRVAGYEIVDDMRKALVELSEYGVPQKRPRVIILALDAREYGRECSALLDRFYASDLPKHRSKRIMTASRAIARYSDESPFLPSEEYTFEGRRYSHSPPVSAWKNHIPRYHNRRDIKTFRDLAFDLRSENPKYLTVNSIRKLYTQRTGKVSAVHKYFVIRPDEPSNLIPAHLYKDGLRHIHWDPRQARSITVREAAALQSFDDDYEFRGPMGEQYKMVGNAVPPRFARKLATAVLGVLERGKS